MDARREAPSRFPTFAQCGRFLGRNARNVLITALWTCGFVSLLSGLYAQWVTVIPAAHAEFMRRVARELIVGILGFQLATAISRGRIA